MRRRSRALGRRAFAFLFLATIGLSFGAWRVPVDAQQQPDGTVLAQQFGGFQLSSRASGLQVTYDSPGLLPISPIVQVSIPEGTSTVSSGPTTYALGGLAHPGPLLANLPAIVAQAGFDFPIPAYPLKVESSSPAGPENAQQSIATGAARTRATSAGAESVTHYAGVDLPGFLRIGGITTMTYSSLEQGQVVSRSRVEVAGLDLLFGLIHIESVVTDVVSTSDAAAAASDGGTTVTGVRVLGTALTLDGNGLSAAPAPAVPANPLDPILDSLPDLGPVNDLVNGVAGPLNDLLQSVLGTVTGTVNELFAAGGISLRVLEPLETISGASAVRRAPGLVLELNYDGETAPIFSDLLAAIPTDQLPSENLPGIPLPSSPQALVNLLKENHIVTIAVGLAEVRSNATPGFQPPASTGGGGSILPSINQPASSPIPGSPTFSTPTPAIPGTTPTTTEEEPVSFLGPGLAPFLILAVLLTSPLWGLGSSRLADNVIGAVGTSCPDGRE